MSRDRNRNDVPDLGSLTKTGDFHKERKRSKKKETFSEGRSLWKLPQLRKSMKVAFGNNLLMISTAA
jgi:hypothetical protein